MKREEKEALPHRRSSALGKVDKKERLRNGRKGERWSQREVLRGGNGRCQEDEEREEDEKGRHF